MSKYTTEVRYICETNTSRPIEGNGFNHIDEIIETSHTNIFNFDYPIFDPLYRAPLERKILRHFYTREICEETVGLWKLRLCDKLNVIMPYYNQLYESALLEFNPLYDVDLTTTGMKNDETEKTNTNTTNANETTDAQNTTAGSKIENKTGTRKSNDTGLDTSIQTNDKTDVTTNDLRETNVSANSKSGSGSNNSRTDNNSTDWDYYSETPQGRVQNLTDGYLTNVRQKTDNSYSTTDGSANYSESENKTDTSANTGTVKVDSNDRIATNKAKTNEQKSEFGEDNNTLHNAVENKQQTKSTDKHNIMTGNIKNMNDYVEHVSGKRGGTSYSKMLLEFRKTFLNIDQLILDELEPLFFGLW